MMNRTCKLIFFILFLAGAINSTFFVLAQDDTLAVIAVRPVVEYSSGQLRDPFQTYIIKEKKTDSIERVSISTQPEIDLSKFKVQGIIWGGKITQAIINDQVFTVGDSIDGVKILSIDKKGVSLGLAEGIAILAAPGQGSSEQKIKGGTK